MARAVVFDNSGPSYDVDNHSTLSCLDGLDRVDHSINMSTLSIGYCGRRV